MGNCLSSMGVDTPKEFKGSRWQAGLGDGAAAFDAAARQYGEPAKPAYTTTADVGMKPRSSAEDKQAAYAFMHDKPAPTPLQLERIEEDATLQGNDISPLKQAPQAMPASDGSGSSSASGAPHVQRKPISWTRGELVGQGAFGSVFVAMDNDTGELIAVKQVQVPRSGGPQAKKVEDNVRTVEEEVQLLQQFDHPNIVRYLGTEKTAESLNIFLEYVPGGSIASLLAKFGSFKESVIKVYTKQILLGLEYLHSKGVMHRDIKGANILVDNTGLVKLADFGASKKLEDLVTVADGNKSVRGTPYWMAPEVITQTGHGRQADLWSVACTVLEMATGRPPWSNQYTSQVAAMFHIAQSKGPPEIAQHLSPECKDFLYLCFNRDWKARPLASTLLQHPFLANVPVRSHGGPSPNAAALAQALRVPRPCAGPPAAAVPEPSDSQFGTPSPLNPKLAGMGGGARISLQTSEGSGPGADGSAALSPLGHAATSRRPQWDSAATQQGAPAASQQQQQPAAAPSREPSMNGRPGGGSPVKRPAMSLRASAPAFSGYASVALSLQSEQLIPRPARPAAQPVPMHQEQPAQEQASATSNLRSSRESSGAVSSATTGVSSQQHQEVRRSSSGRQLQREVSSRALAPPAAVSPRRDVPPVEATLQERQLALAVPQLEIAGVQLEQEPVPAAGVAETPAALQQRSGVQDLLHADESQASGAAAATPDSAGNSSGTSKSDYNPMEEPSWMHPHESPLPGEGTPTSAITAGASPPRRGPAASTARSHEASSYAAAAQAAPVPDREPAAAAAVHGAGAQAAAAEATGAAADFDAHPSADHMVWTNEDGDIDALPWDMGGWSTGSSAEPVAQLAPAPVLEQRQQQEQQLPAASKADDTPVDEDALIGALRRKAQHDVRASMALFEKSLNIPALHSPRSPKAAGAAAGSCSPRTIAAVRVVPPQPAPAAPQSALAVVPAGPAAESIEAVGPAVTPGRRSEGYSVQAPPPASAVAAAAAQHLLSSVRPTATGMLPPPSPLQAAVGGLTELGYSSGGSGSLSRGGDRESIWQQELYQELYKVKASNAGSGNSGGSNRRTSMHGSPLKARLGGINH